MKGVCRSGRPVETHVNILFLTLRREPFLQILGGVKAEEYRDFTPYWTKRLENKRFDYIVFRNGYRSDSPRLFVKWEGMHIDILPDGTKRYAIELGPVFMSNL